MFQLQKAMLELSSQMTTLNSLNELLDIILKKAIEVIPEAEYGSILVMNAEGLLEFKAIYGFKEDLFKVKLDPTESYQWQATNGYFSGALIIQDLSVFSKNFMTEENYSVMDEIDALCPKSSLSAPLLIDGQFFGSINVDSSKMYVFKDEHKKLMTYFANQATIAIRNHQYYEKMLFLSKYDGLTKVMNRHYFQQQIEAILSNDTTNKEPITFVLMDLDNFKTINDQYGHSSGDHILTCFTTSFSSQVSHNTLFARYGGDEFIAIFFNSDIHQTTNKIKPIYDSITKSPIQLNANREDRVYCLFSYGMAEYPTEGNELKTLIHLADQRMYKHKTKIKSAEQSV
jgi:diguanylate cyclase (GGDEF)-like protein